ncbi:ONECUT (homeobox) Associated Motif containing [Caenorhabditis elegans]|uniref:ONECUT (Homeobox) Associated Motif containing n=1 Tax=Caenorhabditis elegans TaxID=6239 RepID=P92014_CAEEL|nr:ONECUT (homeobox) Associated Motif containing [Caenorhabditis elegans]CAB03274.2 ONECUT (homeobox) Associated Motif containing [Caenorhabditis elegans]|eukprot:NP_506507.2 ONECUT (homeobox) Associated Motif containing [Caenorhabditis elegans]
MEESTTNSQQNKLSAELVKKARKIPSGVFEDSSSTTSRKSTWTPKRPLHKPGTLEPIVLRSDVPQGVNIGILLYGYNYPRQVIRQQRQAVTTVTHDPVEEPCNVEQNKEPVKPMTDDQANVNDESENASIKPAS